MTFQRLACAVGFASLSYFYALVLLSERAIAGSDSMPSGCADFNIADGFCNLRNNNEHCGKSDRLPTRRLGDMCSTGTPHYSTVAHPWTRYFFTRTNNPMTDYYCCRCTGSTCWQIYGILASFRAVFLLFRTPFGHIYTSVCIYIAKPIATAVPLYRSVCLSHRCHTAVLSIAEP